MQLLNGQKSTQVRVSKRNLKSETDRLESQSEHRAAARVSKVQVKQTTLDSRRRSSSQQETWAKSEIIAYRTARTHAEADRAGHDEARRRGEY
eukprot:1267128-Rhodomonas_salina.2